MSSDSRSPKLPLHDLVDHVVNPLVAIHVARTGSPAAVQRLCCFTAPCGGRRELPGRGVRVAFPADRLCYAVPPPQPSNCASGYSSRMAARIWATTSGGGC